jgi:hypothetical protein
MFNTFFNPYGKSADDFYYITNTTGKRNYYSRRTGKIVPKKDILPNILQHIKEKNINLSTAELIKKRQCLLKQIDDIKE